MPQVRFGDHDRLFTIGYQGRTIEGFVDLLQTEGIERLVDVRANPWSRKPGFTKHELANHLDQAGIAYEHLGLLGAPDEARHGDLDEATFAAAYQEHLDGQDDALDRLTQWAQQDRTAICCMEKDPQACHRRFIADTFQAQDWHIVHL